MAACEKLSNEALEDAIEVDRPQAEENAKRTTRDAHDAVRIDGSRIGAAGSGVLVHCHVVVATPEFLALVEETARRVDAAVVDDLVAALGGVRNRGGRLFVLGVGGSAANASHAVNDFRKLCGIEAYCPADNVSELTARTNDEGWETTFSEWLRTSKIGAPDAVLVLSVGGGDVDRGVSVNLVRAIDTAKEAGATVLGIVGRDGGYTATAADVAVVIPTVEPSLVTPLSESFQSVILHCVVSHPSLAAAPAKWEGMTTPETSLL